MLNMNLNIMMWLDIQELTNWLNMNLDIMMWLDIQEPTNWLSVFA